MHAAPATARASSPRQHRARVQDLGAERQRLARRRLRHDCRPQKYRAQNRGCAVPKRMVSSRGSQGRQMWFHGRQVGIKFLRRRLEGCHCGAGPSGRAVLSKTERRRLRNSSRASPRSENEIVQADRGAVEIDARSRTRV